MKYLITTVFVTMLVVLANPESVAAQATIAPIALYMDDDNRTGRIVVRNTSSRPAEISVEMVYGYPQTDAEGKLFFKTFDTVPEDAPSAADWIRVYPRHLILPPDEQQTIRFAARPPEGLPHGEYWVRPAVSVRQVNEQSPDGREDIQARINVIQRTVLSLNYRMGMVHTGVEIDSLESGVNEMGDLVVSMDLNRTGNAAYLGSLTAVLMDGEVPVKTIKNDLAIYEDQHRTVTFKADTLPKGEYRIRVILETDSRADQNESIISATPVQQTILVRIQ